MEKEILSHTVYLCRYINSINEIDGRWFKVEIGNQTKERMCVTFLEPYGPW